METGTKKTRVSRRADSPLEHAPASAVEAKLMRSLVQAKAFFQGSQTIARETRVTLATSRAITAKKAPKFGPARIRHLREDTLHLSQSLFAAAMNASTQTVQGWEQGTKRPSGPASRLLQIAEQNPSLIREQLMER